MKTTLKDINKLYHHSLNADEASEEERKGILWMNHDGSGHMLLVIFSKFTMPAQVSQSV